MKKGKLKQRSVAVWLQQATCETEVTEVREPSQELSVLAKLTPTASEQILSA